MFDAKLKGAHGASNLCALNIFFMIISTVQLISLNNSKFLYTILFEMTNISYL